MNIYMNIYVYIIENYPAIKKKEILTFAIIQMKMEGNNLNEMRFHAK